MIAIIPLHNSPGKRDADEFRREARKFIANYGGDLVTFDNRKQMPDRRRDVAEQLSDCAETNVAAFFCHGWKSGLQAGYRISDIDELAASLEILGIDTVCLYACLCASGPRNGEGSFASQLRRAMGPVDVWAHATRGHTTKNPDVVAFDCTQIGGYYPIPRDAPEWPKWVRALRQRGWLKFANTSPWEIANALNI